ncbi:T9SS type A sorting domain-containing protein [Neolewinella sp.]|uniref:T9SS type A sorting domain-containing protein n=1 Tax=Neolewinella sp. TaxID=2993543 RepID=UPI003B521AA1
MQPTFTSNPLAATPLHGLIGLLLLLFFSPTLLAGPPPAASGAIARIENLTKLPGSGRAFPANDYFTLHRSDRTFNNSKQSIKYTDRSKMRIHNDGTNKLVITRLTTTNTSNFRINGAPSGTFEIAPKSYRDVEVLFVTTGGETRRLVTESLIMESNADNASSVRATFRGAYMKDVEGGSEINLQQVIEAFGLKTRLGVDDNGNLQVRPSSYYPSASRVNSGLEGDLILAGLFEQADGSKPVQMIQLAAFHGPGGSPSELRNEASTSIVGDMKYNHGNQYHQTLLPRLTDSSDKPAGDFTSRTGQVFQIILAGYRSTGGTYDNTRKDELLAVRTYKVIDRNGRVVPNEYIVAMDYVGNGCGAGNNNCDWNDNVAYITNVRPRAKPTAKAIASIATKMGETKTVNLSASFDRGYAGNQLTYSARISGGGSLPSWITINSSTGALLIKAPSSAGGQSYRIDVTATDLNRINVTSTLTLSVQGTSTPPPPPPTNPTPPTGAGSYWLEAECAQVGSSFKLNGSSVVSEKRSMSAPPSEGSGNRIRFIFNVSKTGSYNLFARIRARNGDSDSYWVRTNGGSWYKWSSGIAQSADFKWNRLPNSLNLSAGTNTVDFAYREPLAELDKIYVSASGSAPSGSGTPGSNCATAPSSAVYWLEAECAEVGSRWQKVSTGSASNSTYVVIAGRNAMDAPPSDEAANRIRFTLRGTSGGSYNLFARIDAKNGLDDSFWVRANGGPWYKWFMGINQGVGFDWNRLPQVLNLREGANTIDFAYREDGTKLDKLFLTKGSSRPGGLGEPAGNCGSAATQTASVNNEVPIDRFGVAATPTELSLFPNPVSTHLQLRLSSEYLGDAEVIVTDLHGRRVSQRTYAKPANSLQLQLDVTELPAGLYHLQVFMDGTRELRSFVKQ